MGWRTGLATAALAALTLAPDLANAQGYFGGDQSLACATNGTKWRYLGCFNGDQSFSFIPQSYIPSNPQFSYPDFWPTGVINNTMNALSCTQVCRGYGYKYTAIFNQICSCGNIYNPGITASTCTVECGANRLDLCGGVTATDIYVDPTFADPGQLGLLTPLVIGGFSQFLGCFRSPNYPTNTSAATTIQISGSACLAYCGTAGYQMASATYLGM